MKMEKFKAVSIAKLNELLKKLKEKYPERAERVDYIVDVLMAKLHTLDKHNLHDYLFTLHLSSKEFKEFMELVPDEKTVVELLEE
ncbi:MAG: hypothetical protein QXT64_01315 [Desulfurococcaceae archaeon]